MNFHVEPARESSRKLPQENESVSITKQEIIALLVKRSRPKRSIKVNTLIKKYTEEQYDGTGIHI